MKNIFVTICAALVLCALAAFSVLFNTSQNDDNAPQEVPSEEASDTLQTIPETERPDDTQSEDASDEASEKDTTEEGSHELSEPQYIPVGEIRIPQCGSINYSTSSKTSDFCFENPDTNACYLKVSITRLDTNENIFSSTLISPGKSIASIGFEGKLTRQGTYDAMIKIDAYALDRMVHLNSLTIDTVIYAY